MFKMLSAFMITFFLSGCGSSRSTLERYEFSEIIMAVEGRLVLYAPDERAARSAARAAFDRMNDLDAVMSDWRDDSELMQLSKAAGSGPVAVSEDLFRVLACAESISRRSGGAFDVTVGPLTRLWRESRRAGRWPAESAMQRALTLVGTRYLQLDPQHRTAELQRPGMRLDLGGIGKGFAIDEASVVLRERGIEHHLIDLGGDILAGDPPPDAEAWRIGMTSSVDGGAGSISLARAAIATSGDLEQFVEIDGTRFSHIIDPRTGRGLTSGLLVTVIATDATTADALASAISVLGPDAGLELLKEFPCAEAMVEQQTPQGAVISRSKGMPRAAATVRRLENESQ